MTTSLLHAPPPSTDDVVEGVRVVDRGPVREVVLTRDEKRNSLSAAVVERLLSAVLEAATRGTRLLVLRGEGRCFSAGFDLTDLETSSDGDLLLRFVRIERLLAAVEASPVSTLALVHGNTFGAGADLAMACTQRVFDPGARVRMPGLRFGLVLGTRRLARITGPEVAHEILQTSQVLDAPASLAAGLATSIVDASEWPVLVDQHAEAATRLTPEAAAAMRRAISISAPDTDLAHLVRSASEPGLGDRIRAYRSESR